jgi:hypothetical protein
VEIIVVIVVIFVMVIRDVETQAANIGGRQGTVFQSHRSIQSRKNKAETGMGCTTVSGTRHTNIHIHTYIHTYI